ncbi:hypothetical protein HDV00_003254 [Rhizophlyctis rosea]|nr:hypothetical protein HDV00_003254 [Rhizophlyctis rosea]
MQNYVNSDSFPENHFDFVYFDWTCTTSHKEYGVPLETVEAFFRKTKRPVLVVAQTYSLRGKNQNEVPGSGEDTGEYNYPAEKARIDNAVLTAAHENGYNILPNLYEFREYRRDAQSSYMLFTCLAFVHFDYVQIPLHPAGRLYMEYMQRNIRRFTYTCIQSRQKREINHIEISYIESGHVKSIRKGLVLLKAQFDFHYIYKAIQAATT